MAFPPPPPPLDPEAGRADEAPDRVEPWRRTASPGWIWEQSSDSLDPRTEAARALERRRLGARRRRRRLRTLQFSLVFLVATPLLAWGVYVLLTKG